MMMHLWFLVRTKINANWTIRIYPNYRSNFSNPLTHAICYQHSCKWHFSDHTVQLNVQCRNHVLKWNVVFFISNREIIKWSLYAVNREKMSLVAFLGEKLKVLSIRFSNRSANSTDFQRSVKYFQGFLYRNVARKKLGLSETLLIRI